MTTLQKTCESERQILARVISIGHSRMIRLDPTIVKGLGIDSLSLLSEKIIDGKIVLEKYRIEQDKAKEKTIK